MMKPRIRIGLNYSYSKNWIGGLLYAQNLVRALNKLDDKYKPYIDVYCKDELMYEDLNNKTGYPYLNLVIIKNNTFMKMLFRTIVGVLFGNIAKANVNLFKILPEDEMIYSLGFGSQTEKLVYWQPDFQEKHLPEYFKERELKHRDATIRMIAERGIPMVFSSHDSENDFKKFYPEYNNKTFVVHFAVFHDDRRVANIDDVKKKYNIKGDYLLCANQFWKHKNHLFLFKAFQKALKKGLNKQLVCTGRMADYRNPGYIDEINEFLDQGDLKERIILTGLIEYDELHSLIANAYAVVQPSLFEGWNTTVEDCKAMNKYIFLSNLPVHREQIQKNVCFFDPYREDDLVEKLLTVKPVVEPYDYTNNLLKFGEDFYNVIRYVSKRKLDKEES